MNPFYSRHNKCVFDKGLQHTNVLQLIIDPSNNFTNIYGKLISEIS